MPIPIKGEPGGTLKQANRRHGLEITAHTVNCFWDRERMHLHLTVYALMSYSDDPIVDEWVAVAANPILAIQRDDLIGFRGLFVGSMGVNTEGHEKGGDEEGRQWNRDRFGREY